MIYDHNISVDLDVFWVQTNLVPSVYQRLTVKTIVEVNKPNYFKCSKTKNKSHLFYMIMNLPTHPTFLKQKIHQLPQPPALPATDGDPHRGRVVSKLGDLGLAVKSSNTSSDVTRCSEGGFFCYSWALGGSSYSSGGG